MMPKPSYNKNRNQNNSNFNYKGSEKVILETKPKLVTYSDNFISKIIVLFALAFLFAPILAISYNIQNVLLTSFQINFEQMNYIVELIILILMAYICIKLALDVLDWNRTVYTLTDKRIIIQRGIFRREKIIMPYTKIQDIEVSQTIIEGILNAGDIIIYGGHDNSEVILDDVPNPKDVENIIMNQQGNYGFQQNNYNPQRIPQNEPYQDTRYGYNQNYDNQNYYDNVDDRSGYKNNNFYQRSPQVHYFNNDYDNFEEDDDGRVYNSNYKKNKKQFKNGRNKRSKQDTEDIIQKHDQMFKKYNK